MRGSIESRRSRCSGDPVVGDPSIADSRIQIAGDPVVDDPFIAQNRAMYINGLLRRSIYMADIT